MKELPNCAIHGEDDSVRITARIVEVLPSGMPKVVIDFGDVKGVTLYELQKLEVFLMRVYDWRREYFVEGRTK